MRHTKTAVFVSLLFALAAALPAQELNRADFRKMWAQGMSLEDDKILDKATKRGHLHAITYYEEFWRIAATSDNQGAELNAEALMASWERNFGNKDTLTHVQRWVDGCTDQIYKRLQTCRANSAKIWGDYATNVATGKVKKDYESCYRDFMSLAKVAESIGHYQEAADLWGLASVIGSKTPEQTIEDKEGVVFAIEQQLSCRERWGYTFDKYYIQGKAIVKDELRKLEEARKKSDKRSNEGYDADSKGIDALLMPKVAAKTYDLKFEALKDWKAADYGPRGGPAPTYWWLDSLGESGSSRKMGWFRQRDMFLLRRGASKFAVSWTPNDGNEAMAISVSPKAKMSTFYLGTDKSLPYAMFFWIGTDAERTGVAQCNYAATGKLANVYYRSASSWKTQIETEAAVFYDDDASGKPGDGDPFIGELKSHIVGNATGDGVMVPVFDSMKIGKGKRVPYSQFVKLAAGWHYLEIAGGTNVAARPLNPEYVKTGQVKLAWTGTKQTQPDQLVIQGKGDYATAIFDVAGGKPVDVPAGEYSVIWGRMTHGKNARLQTAQIYPTDAHEGFVVKAGEAFTLEMGAENAKTGLKLDFERDGDKISATTICVTEKSGCKITAMHGIGLAADVLASTTGSTKGAKVIGAFQPFVNDQLIGKAAEAYNNLGFMAATFPMPKGYREGEMVLTFKLPADNMKVGLFVKKKHKFFGPLQTVWK